MSPSSESAPLLEVAVLHARDAAAAADGEADRLLLLADPDLGGRSPEPGVVSAVVRETDLPVRVLLRPGDLPTEPDRDGRLVELARTFLDLGAEGVSFGFLDRENGIDRRTCAALAHDLAGVPWSFDRTFDAAFEPRRAWRAVHDLPGIDGVATAGSGRGLSRGADELIAQIGATPRLAGLVIASGGLEPDLVPWLLRAGVRQFALADEARVGRSWKRAHVDAAAVRAWRLLLDDAHQLALGVEVD